MSIKYHLIVVCGQDARKNFDKTLASALSLWMSHMKASDVLKPVIISKWMKEAQDNSLKRGEKCEVLTYEKNSVRISVFVKPTVDSLTHALYDQLSCQHTAIFYIGSVLESSGNWMLKDGVFSSNELKQVFADKEVSSRLAEQNAEIFILTRKFGNWSDSSFFSQESKVIIKVMDPSDMHMPISDDQSSPTAGHTNTSEFEGILHDLTSVLNNQAEQSVFTELRPPTEEGFLKIRNPCIYVFPAGNGDSAVFAVNEFNMLVNGGSGTSPSYWNLVRHLDRIDSILCTHNGTDNLVGINMLLTRKQQEMAIRLKMADTDANSVEYQECQRLLISPKIGPLFYNPPKNLPTIESLEENVISAKQCITKLSNLTQDLKLSQHFLTRKGMFNCEPLTLFTKFGVGRLDMYVLNPLEGSKEYEFIREKWAAKSKAKAKTGVTNASGEDGETLLSNLASISCLLVWQPSNPDAKVVRVLFSGNAPETKVIEGLQSVKHLNILKAAHMTAKIAKEVSAKATKVNGTKLDVKSSAKATNGDVKPSALGAIKSRVKRGPATSLSSVDKRTKSEKPPPKPRAVAEVNGAAKTRNNSSTKKPMSRVPAKPSSASSSKTSPKAAKSQTAPTSTKSQIAPTSTKSQIAAKPKPTSRPTSTRPKSSTTTTTAKTTKASTLSAPKPSALKKSPVKPSKPMTTASPAATRTKKVGSVYSVRTPTKLTSSKHATTDKEKAAKKKVKAPPTPPIDLTEEFTSMKKEENKKTEETSVEKNIVSPVLSKRTSPEGEDLTTQQKFEEVALKAEKVEDEDKKLNDADNENVFTSTPKEFIREEEKDSHKDEAVHSKEIETKEVAAEEESSPMDKKEEVTLQPEQNVDTKASEIPAAAEHEEEKVEDVPEVEVPYPRTSSLADKVEEDENVEITNHPQTSSVAENEPTVNEPVEAANQEEVKEEETETAEVDQDHIPDAEKPRKSISFVDSVELEERMDSNDSMESRKKIEEREVTPFPSSNESNTATDVTPNSDNKQLIVEVEKQDVDNTEVKQEQEKNTQQKQEDEVFVSKQDEEEEKKKEPEKVDFAFDLQSTPNSSLEGSYELVGMSPMVSEGTSKQVETLADANIPELKEDSVGKDGERKVSIEDTLAAGDNVQSVSVNARMDSPLTTEQPSSMVSADVNQCNNQRISSRPTEEDISSLMVKSTSLMVDGSSPNAPTTITTDPTPEDSSDVQEDVEVEVADEEIAVSPEDVKQEEGLPAKIEKETPQHIDELSDNEDENVQVQPQQDEAAKQEIDKVEQFSSNVDEEKSDDLHEEKSGDLHDPSSHVTEEEAFDKLEENATEMVQQENQNGLIEKPAATNGFHEQEENKEEVEVPVKNLVEFADSENMKQVGEVKKAEALQVSDEVEMARDEEDDAGIILEPSQENIMLDDKWISESNESEPLAESESFELHAPMNIEPAGEESNDFSSEASSPNRMLHHDELKGSLEQDETLVEDVCPNDQNTGAAANNDASPLKPAVYSMDELKQSSINDNETLPDFYYDGPDVKDYTTTEQVIPHSDLSLTPDEKEEQPFDLHGGHAEQVENIPEWGDEVAAAENLEEEEEQPNEDSSEHSSQSIPKTPPRYHPAYVDDSAPLADVEGDSQALNPLADPFMFSMQQEAQVDPMVESHGYQHTLSEGNPFMEDLMNLQQQQAAQPQDTSPPVRKPDPCAADKSKASLLNKAAGSKATGKRTGKPSLTGDGGIFHVDMAYVPHHANSNSCGLNFFKQIRARYYVISGCDASHDEPSLSVLNALLEGKRSWHESGSLENETVTVLPTHDSPTLKQWYQDNYKELDNNNIHLVASGSKVLVQNESIEACKIEF